MEDIKLDKKEISQVDSHYEKFPFDICQMCHYFRVDGKSFYCGYCNEKNVPKEKCFQRDLVLKINLLHKKIKNGYKINDTQEFKDVIEIIDRELPHSKGIAKEYLKLIKEAFCKKAKK